MAVKFTPTAPKAPKAPQPTGKLGLPAPPTPSPGTPPAGGFGAEDVVTPSPTPTDGFRAFGPNTVAGPGAQAFDRGGRTPPKPGPQAITDVPTRVTTPTLTPTANPFEAPSRQNFNPATTVPESVAEAGLTAAWLKLPENAITILPPSDDFGGPTQVLLGDGSVKDATAEDIAKAEFNQTLSVQIANVRKSALEFKFQQASSAGVVSEEAAIAEIDSQVAIQAAELDKAVSLDPALGKLEKQKLDATQKRAIDFLKAQTAANLEIDQFNADVASAVFDKQFSNTLQLEQMAQTFAAEQSALDRALRRDELATAQTSAAALDELARGQLALQESQFKLDVFSTLIQSPQILAFLGEAGIAQFGDLLGDGGAAIQELIANVSEGGPAANIQQFARLSPQEQATEAFRISALSGTAPGDIGTSLQQAAPTAAFQTSGLRTSRLGL